MDNNSKDAFLSLPYYKRQLILVIDDEKIEEAKGTQTENKYSASDFIKAIGVEAAKGFLIPGYQWYALYKSIAQAKQKLNNEGIDLLPVAYSDVAGVKFPVGHPREEILYVGHPAANNVYYPVSLFHRLTFEHKFSEAIFLLENLCAIEIEVEIIKGWSRDFSSRLSVAIPQTPVDIGADAGSSRSANSQILYKATYQNKIEPKIPDNLIWYNHEPTWQRIADGRLRFGLKNFSLSVNYENDFGVNAGLKVKVEKVGLDIGGTFEDHQGTIWKINGAFA